MKSKCTVKVPGTCGELVQGMLGGIPFHVTCPVNMYSSVTVELDDSPGEIHFPYDLWKSGSAVKKTLEYFRAGNPGGNITIESVLPSGSGWGL